MEINNLNNTEGHTDRHDGNEPQSDLSRSEDSYTKTDGLEMQSVDLDCDNGSPTSVVSCYRGNTQAERGRKHKETEAMEDNGAAAADDGADDDGDNIENMKLITTNINNEPCENIAEGEDDALPIDRGWAWVVLMGCFLNAMLVGGYDRSLALFFVEYLEMFGASTTKTTLILGVKAMTYSLMSLVTMNVLLEFLGTRKTVMMGGLLIVLAILSATFAPNIMVLICVHSVLSGMGDSMIHSPAIVLIGKYFKKRRGLATAIASSAMSLASGIFPVFSQYLLDKYGIRGTLLIYTGLMMNIWVGAYLYRPLHFYKRKVKQGDAHQLHSISSVGVEASEVFSEEDVIGTGHGAKQTYINHNGSTRSCNVVVNDTANRFLNPQNADSFRKRTYSEGSKRIPKEFVSESEKLVYISNPDLVSIPIFIPKLCDSAKKEIRVDDSNQRKSAVIRNFGKVIKAFDFSLFKNPMFLLIVACCQFGVVQRHVPTYLPAQMKEMGYNKSDAAFLLLISGILDFFSRLFYGFIADLGYLRACQIMAIGLVISGLASQFIMFYTTYPLLLAYCVVIGIFGSAFPCLLPLVIVDFMGVDYMAKTLGFAALFQGIAISLTHPILGALRDLSGSYLPCFQYLGAAAVFSAALLLFEPLVRRYVATTREGSPSTDNECMEPLK